MSGGAQHCDLRSQLNALLAGSQPRTTTTKSRKLHPLYGSGSGSGGASSSKHSSSARRSKSQPTSPTGVSKGGRPPRTSGSVYTAGAGSSQSVTCPTQGVCAAAVAAAVRPLPQRRGQHLQIGVRVGLVVYFLQLN